MTQKELSYFEDAIGHEDNIIKIITESINNITDLELASFLENERNKHNEMKERLINLLESECNE